jgi:hypothetical protein
MISIIVSLGFIGQRSDVGFVPACIGDEFDHMRNVVDCKSDVELIIVDRAWPFRWDRVRKVFDKRMEFVKYISPKHSMALDHGYRNCSSSRNSGAICSNGDILMFVDDYCMIDPLSVDKVWEEYCNDKSLLCPYIGNEKISSFGTFSGHNPGVYVCTREQFITLNGFEENLDGAYGEEDTEFENRLDSIIDVDCAENRRRFREPGVEFLYTKHHNGWYPTWSSAKLKSMPYGVDPLWDIPVDIKDEDDADKWRKNLRCNRSLVKNIYSELINNRRRISANDMLSDTDIDILRSSVCDVDCPICSRPDRGLQVDSYRILYADKYVGEKMSRFSGEFFHKNGLVESNWSSLHIRVVTQSSL